MATRIDLQNAIAACKVANNNLSTAAARHIAAGIAAGAGPDLSSEVGDIQNLTAQAQQNADALNVASDNLGG